MLDQLYKQNHIQKISCLHFERECDDASMSISIFPLAKIYGCRTKTPPDKNPPKKNPDIIPPGQKTPRTKTTFYILFDSSKQYF